MTDTDYRAIVAEHGLPTPPDGEIVYVRCTFAGQDWYVEVKGKGWFWCNGRTGVTQREWKYLPQGPSL